MEEINKVLHEEREQEEIEAELDVENKNIQKIYIKNYGNLVLEIIGSNEIGLSARSEKRKETMFIPWGSIIFCSKLDKGESHDK